MDAELEAFVARAQDPTLIPGIYHYCDRRCERCPFTSRCFSFREDQEQLCAHGDRGLVEHIEANFQMAANRMQAWCERKGIDFARIQADAESDAEHARRRIDDPVGSVDGDPLDVSVERYTHAAYDLVEPLRSLSPFHDWPREVADALDTIAWHAGMIGAKVDRALHGAADSTLFGDDDPIQNDRNGSAKAARLAIAESLVAWDTLFACGRTPPDAPIRETRMLLERIDRDVAERFPRAMDFVRPGFDEPEVAAGGLTSLAPFEPRRRTLRQRLLMWLARVRSRLGRS